MTDALVDRKVLKKSFWVQLLTRNDPRNLHPSYIAWAHQKLLAENAEEYWPEKVDPAVYFDTAIKFSVAMLERTVQTQAMSTDTASKVLQSIEQTKLGGRVQYLQFLRIGSKLIHLLNQHHQTSHPDLTQQSQQKDFSAIGQVGWAILNVLYPNEKARQQPFFAEDVLLMDLAEELAWRGQHQLNNKKVLTLEELALRYPRASQRELAAIAEELRTGHRRIHYDPIRREAYQRRTINRPGYGRLS